MLALFRLPALMTACPIYTFGYAGQRHSPCQAKLHRVSTMTEVASCLKLFCVPQALAVVLLPAVQCCSSRPLHTTWFEGGTGSSSPVSIV